ncbi:hypothetical protein Vretimale_19565 [Volvox reticuliferus]|nr:hypothetical protein Vretimale_19565 [Volvox reticuliferus]
MQVCLVRRVPEHKYAPSAPGRAIPLNDTVKPLSYIGPLEVQPDGTVVGLPEPFEPSSYFYTYVCRRSPIVLRGDNQNGKAGKVRLPDGWKATVRAVAEVVGGELRLPQGILGRGRRVRMTSRTNFERLLREKEQELERRRILAARGGSLSQVSVEQLRNPNKHPDHRQYGNHQDQQQDADLDLDSASGQQGGAFNHVMNNQQPTTAPAACPRPKTAQGLTTVSTTQDVVAVLSGRLSSSFGFGGDGAAAAAEGADHGGRIICSSLDSQEGDCGDCGGYSCGSYGSPRGRGSGGSEGEAVGAARREDEQEGSSPGRGTAAETLRWFGSEDSRVVGGKEGFRTAGEHSGERGRPVQAYPAPTPTPTEPSCADVAPAAAAAAAASDVGGGSSTTPGVSTAAAGAGLESCTAGRAISYRRLSATVQDAFALLDAVDGAGCPLGPHGLDSVLCAVEGGGGLRVKCWWW